MVSCLAFVASILLVSVSAQNVSNASTPTGSPTLSPTASPIADPWHTNSTYDCNCATYITNNYTNDAGNGCISGDDICATCPDLSDDTVCVCEKSAECELIHDVVKALATAIIVLIVAAVLCFLCFVAGCIYCWCAGIMCCAVAAKRGGNGGDYQAHLL